MKVCFGWIAKLLLSVSAIGVIVSQFFPSMITSLVPNLLIKSLIGLVVSFILYFIGREKKRNIYGRV